MDRHVEDKPQGETVNEETAMRKNESTKKIGFSGLTHHCVRRLIHEPLKERQESGLQHIIENE